MTFLRHFRIPNVTVTSGESGLTELELSDDPYDCLRIDVTNAPCIVTLNKVKLAFNCKVPNEVLTI